MNTPFVKIDHFARTVHVDGVDGMRMCTIMEFWTPNQKAFTRFGLALGTIDAELEVLLRKIAVHVSMQEGERPDQEMCVDLALRIHTEGLSAEQK